MNEQNINPEIKKQINEEEMPQLEKKLEIEGIAADLGSYIKMHREIAVPYQELSPGIAEKIMNRKGRAWFLPYDDIVDERMNIIHILTLRYVDKDANIIEVKIDASKISSHREKYIDKKESYYYYIEGLKKELKELNFNVVRDDQARKDDTTNHLILNREVFNYRKKLEEKNRGGATKEFDF